MVTPSVISEEEAQKIITSLDVVAFNERIPYPMRDDRAFRRLEVYKSRLNEDALKSPTDPTRSSASFLLGRDQFHGASSAGSLIKLALLHMNVDTEIVRSFDWSYANVDHYIAQRVGLWDPLRSTPVMNQGHWQEGVIRARLESEQGYRFDPNILREVNSQTLRSMPDVKVTIDEAGYHPTGYIVANEFKQVADPFHDFDKVEDIHFMQGQAQMLVMEESDIDFQGHEIHYPDLKTGLIHSFKTEPVPELQNLYLQGCHIANEYIEAGHIPNLDKVQVSVLPLSSEQQQRVSKLTEIIEVASLVGKEAENRKKDANAALTSIFKENGMGKKEISAKNIFQDTNRPTGTMKLYMTERVQPKKVMEAVEQHGLYDQVMKESENLTPGHKAAIKALEEQGIDTKQFMNYEADIDVALELLSQKNVELESFVYENVIASSTDVKSKAVNRAEAKQYSEQLRVTAKGAADLAIQKTLEDKVPVQVLARAASSDAEVSQEESTAPTRDVIDDITNTPGS